MRSRRSVPEAIGLSTLDLICGLFGLLVVLFAITERVDGLPGVPSHSLKFVKVETEGNDLVDLGLELTVNGNSYHNWPDCTDVGPVRWGSCKPGLVEAVIEGDKPATALRVLAISRWDGRPLVSGSVKVLVSTPDADTPCELTHDNFYRVEVDSCAP
ncbi:MAG: hypothetical protein OXE53_11075 [Deltaproteobacteria bacterium]|nr:hypothetical protein [Deltaproteobacteria bacterium]